MTSEADIEWQECLTSIGITDATLLQASPQHPNQRTYRHYNSVFKIRRLPDYDDRKSYSDIRKEYYLLSKCADLPGIPRALRFMEQPGFIAFEMEYVPGSPVMSQSENSFKISMCEACRMIYRLMPILYRLSSRGVAHNDLKLWNVMRTPDNQIVLIDFDQGTETSFSDAFYRNFIALRGHGKATSLAYIVGKCIKPVVPHAIVRWVRKRTGYMMPCEHK